MKRSVFNQFAGSAAFALNLALLSLTACKPSSPSESADSKAAQQGSEIHPEVKQKIIAAGFPNLAPFALQLIDKQNKKETFSVSESIRFITQMHTAWVADLRALGSEIPLLPQDNLQTSALLTELSLRKGVFIQPGFTETKANSDRLIGRLGFYSVQAFKPGDSLLSKIKVANFSPNAENAKVDFFEINAEVCPAPIAFIATTGRVDRTDGYVVIINRAAQERHLVEICAGRTAAESDFLRTEFNNFVYLNEISTVALDQFFRIRGISKEDYQRADLLFGNTASLKISLGSIYEAFSDLSSWQNSNLPLWAHMKLLNRQSAGDVPAAYLLSLSIQWNAITQTTNSNRQLDALIQKTFPAHKDVTIADLVPLLQANPALDSSLKAQVVAAMSERTYSLLFSASKALEAEKQ